MLRVSLEQWRSFVATAELGSFQKAAEELGKTPSAVGHAIRKMEASLQQRLFDLDGRRARITPIGKTLLPHARDIIEEARNAERLCNMTCAECREGEGEIPVAVDVSFPIDLLLKALNRLSEGYPHLSVTVREASPAEAPRLLEESVVRIAISSTLPTDFPTMDLISVPFVCVAGRGHPLAGATLAGASALDSHLQILVQDVPRFGPVKASQRLWTFSQFTTALPLLRSGAGYAWLPEHVVRDDLRNGVLVELDVEPAEERRLDLAVGFREAREDCGVVLAFVNILRDLVADRDTLAVGDT